LTYLNKDVDVFLHALALHETQSLCWPTSINIHRPPEQIVNYTWFPGNRYDLTWQSKTGCFADMVIAWAIDNLEKQSGIVFDKQRTDRRFGCDASQNRSDNFWEKDCIGKPNHSLWRFIGYKSRQPGTYGDPNSDIHEYIHWSAQRSTVSGYSRDATNYLVTWIYDESNQSRSVMQSFSLRPHILRETPVSSREAGLLGIAKDNDHTEHISHQCKKPESNFPIQSDGAEGCSNTIIKRP
jgi:hypothetical protein